MKAMKREAHVTLADITEHERMKEALQQSIQYWERTFDTIPDLIAILDSQQRIVRVNQAMAHRLGVTPEQCIGLNCFTCVHGTSSPPESCPHVLTLKDGKEHMTEIHEDHLGGDFLVSTMPLLDKQGQTTGTVHVA